MEIVEHEDVFNQKKTNAVEVKLATIAPGYVSGRPQLIFSGETIATLKTYPHMAHYTPSSNDRVMLIKGVVIGKIV
ncbi:hypothetical protein [Planococcus sp. ANT_H30]|uniref:hypothetical protein n=1 Tax=Planococcus sp. ANT_H30 TaxID=2597347 RepID=UPI0021D1036C|nr:hypothetical protein [Planococcus sp. ANT_H30]